MNARADIPPGPPARVVPLPVARHRRLADCTLVPLADGVSGLFFDTPPSDPDDTAGRLVASVDDSRLPPPVITTRLALRSGGTRHLLLAGRGAETLLGRHLRLDLGDRAAALIDPSWLQPPLGDATALIEGLADDGRRRLLKLFLTTGPSLFGARSGAAFGPAARRLLEMLGVQPVAPATVCALGAGCIVSYRVPGPVDPERAGEVVALDGARSQRLPDCRLVAETRDRATLLHIHLPRLPPAGGALVALGPAPLQLRLPGDETPVRSLLAWLERRDDDTRGWVHGLVEAAAPTDPMAAALMRELRYLDGAAPVLSVRHLSATPRGVLFAFELADDEDLVREIRLERGDGRIVIPGFGRWRKGYAVLPRRSAIADDYRLQLVFHSGRTSTVAEGRLAPFRGLPPAPFGTADAAALAAASLDRERPDQTRLARGTRVCSFGRLQGGPVLRILVPLGETPDATRARAALVAGEQRKAQVEVLCHGHDEAADAVMETLADTEAVFGVPHRVVGLPRAAEAADCLRAALALAADAPALLLGRNVLPAGPGWLSPWLRRLGSPWAVLGGALLDHDGAVLHAGGAIVVVGDEPARRLEPHRGLPATRLPRAAARAGGLMTSDCVGLAPAAVARLAAEDPACPTPDVALALATRRLSAEGAATGTFLRGHFVRYGGASASAMPAAVEACVLGTLLKRSFSLAVQEDRP